jgi:hypothetical protein
VRAPSRRSLSWTPTLAFAIAFIGALAIAMLQGEKPFYNDSGGYWQMGTTFTLNGHFSLLNFNNLEKGYVFALITHGLQVLGSDLTWTSSSMVKIFNAFLFAAIGAVLGPGLIRAVWPNQPPWSLMRRLVLMALLLVFWSGFLNFPLSDFPALTVALLALVAVSRTDNPGWMLLAGVALSMAINIRASYALLGPAVVALIAWRWFEQRGTQHASARRRMLCASLFAIGFAVVALPQSLSAHRYYGTWSFIPGTAIKQSAGEFYSDGIRVQAYDAYLLNGEPRVEMRYVYPAGLRLLEEQKGGEVTTTSQYLGLFVSHPLVMGGMIVRHIVNGLDPLHSTYIVENLHNAGRIWGRIAGYLLVFLALLRLLWPAARRMLGAGRLRYLTALALCCVSIVPTQMERRYMLPIYLLVYALALTPRWPNPIGSAVAGLRRFKTTATITVAFAVYAVFVWYITSDAISHLTFVDGITQKRLNIQ